ncbi:hypothetical protein SBC1_75320 (plasmid) [Caballeronia sp. SBC1]|nr:hypothetical protein SBC2_82050 [Caballeronia sp. SBC2]QIN67485.1 hypothetical protein SBC1_75320 [Caballeronia sp. SBC1]
MGRDPATRLPRMVRLHRDVPRVHKTDASSRSRRPIQRDAFATRPLARQAEQESDPSSETAQAVLGPMWSFSKLPPPDIYDFSQQGHAREGTGRQNP